ncbi:MAG: Bacillithiol biosynthesis BshC, partial [Geminicoccaceae bacterium]|nr:Bacillithiol biosynthesis BshC [Geminicoccaceae bacterium]
RQEIELGQIAKARAVVLPDNKPQERILNIAPFVARYGPSLLLELGEVIEGWYATTLEGALNPS